jgi:hypothetical protein
MNKPRLSTERVLTDEHYVAIGKIAVEWTYVELDIQAIIWHLADLVEGPRLKTAHAFTTHLGTETLLDILKTLVHNATGECAEYDALKTFIDKDVKPLRTLRNEIIHGLYYLDADHSDSASSHKIRAKGKLQYSFANRKASDLESIALQIAGLRPKLDALSVWRKALPSKYVGPQR